jgi:hypothetical protein
MGSPQDCLADVLFAVRFFEGGLVYSAAAGPVGMPEAFVGELCSMEHRWADMSELLVALRRLSVHAALKQLNIYVMSGMGSLQAALTSSRIRNHHEIADRLLPKDGLYVDNRCID